MNNEKNAVAIILGCMPPVPQLQMIELDNVNSDAHNDARGSSVTLETERLSITPIKTMLKRKTVVAENSIDQPVTNTTRETR